MSVDIKTLLQAKLKLPRPGFDPDQIPEDKRHLFVGSMASDIELDGPLILTREAGVDDPYVTGKWLCSKNKTGHKFFRSLLEESTWNSWLVGPEDNPELQMWLDDMAFNIKACA